jgi:integrase
MESHQLKRSEATLTSREAVNIINSTRNYRDRCIIKCLYYGGLRVQEVVNLEAGDLDFQRRVMHIRKSKFGKTRTVPFIDANFLTDLRQLTQGYKATDPVFPIKRRMVQHIVRKAGEVAGITHPYTGARHVSPHLFRHSIARHLKSAGYAAEFIQKFLGHNSIQTTMDTYGTLSLGEMQQTIAQKTGDSTLIGDAKSVRPELPRDQ